MRNSKLLTVVVATALMFANVACACASSDMGSEPTPHHHTASQDTNDAAPCPHQDCEGCDELLDSCSATDQYVVSVDRDTRTAANHKVDLDDPELNLAFLDTGQILGVPTSSVSTHPRSTSAVWVADTPIRRKDQLIE